MTENYRYRSFLNRLTLRGEEGTDENDLYYVDVDGHGYATKEDYEERQNKMGMAGDGQWYPQQYGK